MKFISLQSIIFDGTLLTGFIPVVLKVFTDTGLLSLGRETMRGVLLDLTLPSHEASPHGPTVVMPGAVQWWGRCGLEDGYTLNEVIDAIEQ